MSTKKSLSKIQKLEEQLMSAMINRNLHFLENIYSENYVFLSSDGSICGKEKALSDYRNPKFQLKKIEIQNYQIRMHNSTAIVTGISIVEGQIDQNPLTGKYLFMRVWNKNGNNWEIIAVTTSNAGGV